MKHNSIIPATQASPFVLPYAFSAYELILSQQFGDKYFAYDPENIRNIMKKTIISFAGNDAESVMCEKYTLRFWDRHSCHLKS